MKYFCGDNRLTPAPTGASGRNPGTTEADPFENKISNESPVGKAVIGKKIGDVVIAVTPAGELSYKILEVK